MSETQVELVEAERLSIDLPSVGASMAVRTEGNKIFIVVISTRCPRDDVMKVNLDMPTSWDGASMPSFDQNAALELGGYGCPVLKIP